MDDSVAIGAIRRMSIDIANLTGQAALMQSSIDYVKQVAREVMPDTWDKRMSDEGDGGGQHPEMVMTVRGDQCDAVMRLLAALDTLG